MLFVSLCLLCVFHPTLSNPADEHYVELSMELTIALENQPEVTEQELHDLAKQVVVHSDNHPRQAKVYEEFLATKTPEFQKFFRKTILEPKAKQHVTDRLEKILGYYLTKDQINRFRVVLVQQMAAQSSRDETVVAIKQELGKDLGEEKATKAVDMVLKDLRLLYKMHGPLVQQLDKPMAHSVRDEL